MATEADLLHEIIERFDDAEAQWADIRTEAAKDMRYISGDPWDQKDKDDRDKAGRPHLALDELGQYVNQTVNSLRQNKRGITVSPAGAGATAQTASFRQGKIRDIEYRSNAQQAYTSMGENALQRSYGFLRIKAQYVGTEGFDQELRIEPCVNPDLVTPDPYHLRPDGADMRFLFYREERSIRDFKREWPDASVTDFGTAQTIAPAWVKGDDRIYVGEYWTKDRAKQRTKLLLKPFGRSAANPNPQPVEVWEDALHSKPSSDLILKSRKVDVFKVRKHLTNGVEILETSEWPGQSIPFVTCYGKVIYVEGKKSILSMIRLARDPYMLYCYYRTCEAELVGATTKNPVWAYAGQLTPQQLIEVQKSLHEPVAALFAEATVPGLPPGQILPLPVQNRFEPPIQALEAGAEAARRAIQAAMGISPLPTNMQRDQRLSGTAQQELKESGQIGTYHYSDHYDESITRTGAILDELIPFYYDTARETSTRKPDDSVAIVRINDPAAQDKDGQPAHIDTQVGDHDVTISVGPALASERAASSDFADTIVANPEIMQIVGPQKMALILAQAIKLKGLGPIGDQMAEIISPKDDGQGDPNQIKQQAAQLHQQVQDMGQKLQQAGQIIQTKQVEAQSREKIMTLQLASKERIAAADREAKIAVAELGAKVDRLSLFLEERARIGLQDATATQALHDRAHDVGMAAQDHANALQQGQATAANAADASTQDHQEALDAGQQGHQNTLEQGQQAADLAPDPTQEAGV